MAWRERVAEGLEPQATITPYLTRRFGKVWGLTAYGMAGLTSASSRIGGGLWLSWFR